MLINKDLVRYKEQKRAYIEEQARLNECKPLECFHFDRDSQSDLKAVPR